MTDDSSAEGGVGLSDGDPPPRDRTARIQIAHYLLLTSVCVVVGVVRNRWVNWDEVDAEWSTAVKLHTVGVSLLYAGAFSALAVLIQRGCARGRLPFEAPGHWLLAFVSTAALLQGVVSLMVSVYHATSKTFGVDYYAWHLNELMLCSSVGVTSFIFAWRINGTYWWKCPLLLGGTALIALVPQHVVAMWNVWRPWFAYTHNCASFAVSSGTLVLLMIACWTEHRRRSSFQDWLHWAGVAVLAAAALGEGISTTYWVLNLQ